MSSTFTESDVEEATLSWLEELGYVVLHGTEIAPDAAHPERASYSDVILKERVREAIEKLNLDLPAAAKEEALRRLMRPEAPTLVGNNRRFHRMLIDGVPVEYSRPDGTIAGAQVRLVAFDDVRSNDFLAVNQFTVVEDQNKAKEEAKKAHEEYDEKRSNRNKNKDNQKTNK